MNAIQQRIAENLAEVRGRISAAAQRSGRAAGDVRLVAATKYVGLPEIQALLACGCRDFGESRPQSLWAKSYALTGEEIRWHLIGQLQRNKLRRTLPLTSWIHSCERWKTVQAVDEMAGELNLSPSLLLEVNISGDAAKQGFRPDELPAACEQMLRLQNLRICGLMAMAGLDDDLPAARREFGQMRELRNQLAARFGDALPLPELSMGMSGDYEAAIESGATMVRVGSALFAGLPTSRDTDEPPP